MVEVVGSSPIIFTKSSASPKYGDADDFFGKRLSGLRVGKQTSVFAQVGGL